MVFLHNNCKLWLRRQESMASTRLCFYMHATASPAFLFLTLPSKNIQEKGQRGTRPNVVRVFFFWIVSALSSGLQQTTLSRVQFHNKHQTVVYTVIEKAARYLRDLVMYGTYSTLLKYQDRFCKWLSLVLSPLICMIIFFWAVIDNLFHLQKLLRLAIWYKAN